jgi:sugar phosphate isomerase/epimerase
MAKIPIGVQLYSVRDDFAKDPYGTLKAVAAMGYSGVEFAGPPAQSGALLRAMLDDVGLVCCGWHTPFEMVLDDRLAATIALNKTVGNRRVIVPGLPQDRIGSRAKWLKMADFFNRLADKLAPHDMVTGYHNHFAEFSPLEGEAPWDTLFGNTERRVIMQFDTGNAAAGGADVLAVLKKYPGRAGAVHIKPYSRSDVKGDLNEGFRRPIGQDELPWAQIFALCEGQGATDWYIVEYESDVFKPLVAVDHILKALRAMGK